MRYNHVFVEKALQLIKHPSYKGYSSLEELISGWESFIESCEGGYHWDMYEYSNDMWVRRKIDKILSSKELIEYPDLDYFKQVIDSLDARFRKLLDMDKVINDSISNWWERHPLRFSDEAYVYDMFRTYGIVVKQVD